jgi:SAM-dependent methyltransferase
MDVDLRRQMLAYYNERAPEYEEAYIRGTGTSSIHDPKVFITEAVVLGEIVSRCVSGRVLDLACGTAYWLKDYAHNCSHVTLIDQSERMLAECRSRVEGFGWSDRCSLVQADFFQYSFPPNAYDWAVVGFFLSHLTKEQEILLFDALKLTLGAAGQFLILDSAWSPMRARTNTQIENQLRRLNDGTEFRIYKRYLDGGEIHSWQETYGVTVEVDYLGDAFCAVRGRFQA